MSDILQQLQQGLQWHQAGRLDQAEQAYRGVLAVAPDTFDAWHLLGVARLQRGDAAGALEGLEKAVQLKPDNAAALGNVGVTYKRLGRIDDAERALRQALEADAGHADAALNLAGLLVETGRGAEAVPLAHAVASANPGDVGALTVLADALSQTGNADEARQLYEGALKLAPNDDGLMRRLGLLHLAAGSYDDAIVWFRKRLVLDPTRADALNDLGQVLQRQHRHAEARDAYKAAVGGEPRFTPAWANLGGVLFELGERSEDRAKAIEAYDTALGQAPELAPALANRGVARLDAGDVAGALADLRAAAARGHVVAAAWAAIVAHQHEGAPLPNPADVEDEAAKAALETAHFMAAAPGAPPLSTHTLGTLEQALAAARPDGLVCEFGVYFGHSLKFLASLTDAPLHGFDSFEGLPADWFAGEAAGSYSTSGRLPTVPDHVSLHVGWFDATLPRFLEAHPDAPLRFANIDCDVYDSTHSVLTALAPRLGAGTVLVFDEYGAYSGWQDHEHKAFTELLEAHPRPYRFLSWSPFTRQAVVLLEG